jgi:hypothetical protein
MSVIATLIESHRVTRVFLDGDASSPADQRHIEQAIECSLTQAAQEEALSLAA